MNWLLKECLSLISIGVVMFAATLLASGFTGTV